MYKGLVVPHRRYAFGTGVGIIFSPGKVTRSSSRNSSGEKKSATSRDIFGSKKDNEEEANHGSNGKRLSCRR